MIDAEPQLSWLTPDWRRQAVREIYLARQSGLRIRVTDPCIRRVLLMGKPRKRVINTPLDHIMHIHRYDLPLRSMLQALLLAGANDKTISHEIGLTVEDVQLYHDYLFDVRGRPHMWIESKVLNVPLPDIPDDSSSQQPVIEPGSTSHDHLPRLGFVLGARLFIELLHGSLSDPSDLRHLAQIAQNLAVQQYLRQAITAPDVLLEKAAKARRRKRAQTSADAPLPEMTDLHALQSALNPGRLADHGLAGSFN